MRLIDGDKLLKQFEKVGECDECGYICEQDGNYCDYMKMRNLIKDAPTIEAEPVKHGHWVKLDTVETFDIAGVKTWALKAMCSECGFAHRFIEAHMVYDYCPNCGADMMDEVTP